MDAEIQEKLAAYQDPARVAHLKEIEVRLRTLIGDSRSFDEVVSISESENRSLRFLSSLLRDR
jgi:hypothetical protein